MPPQRVIVLDARLTRQMSVGMKTYVRELVARLPRVAPDLRFCAVTNVDLAAPDISLLRVSDSAAANFSIGEQFALPGIMRDRGHLAHYLSVYAPRWSSLPYVYTIHDLIHRRFPEYFSWKVPPYYQMVAGPVARAARAVITDAQATVADLHAYLGVDAPAARVVPLGVAESFHVDAAARERQAAGARARFSLHAPFVLYAGNHRKHKNLETLFDAWSRLDRACDLVITEDGPFAFDIDRYARRAGRTVLLGHVRQEELVQLYAACAAVVQPSSYEGFGLSVLESMAAGAPVVVARTPALLEVAGDAALTFAPSDPAGLSAQLAVALAGGAAIDAMRGRGRERAAEFTWDRTARMTADVYREALRA